MNVEIPYCNLRLLARVGFDDAAQRDHQPRRRAVDPSICADLSNEATQRTHHRGGT
jgi:hypothetical protein